MANDLATQTRRGRPCGVCSLPADKRLAVETALAEGSSISRISKLDWAPGRESIANHLQGGHLPAQLQDRAERAQGVDFTTVVARISDIATRARTTALEAAEAGDRQGVLRAGDSELRALGVLAASGETSEADITRNRAWRDTAVAVLRVARRDIATAETIASELDQMHRPDVADEVREQFPETREVSA